LSRRLVLDAGILVEYIVAGSPYREFVEDLFSKSERSELELYVSAVTLAEVLYVTSRIQTERRRTSPHGSPPGLESSTWILR